MPAFSRVLRLSRFGSLFYFFVPFVSFCGYLEFSQLMATMFL